MAGATSAHAVSSWLTAKAERHVIYVSQRAPLDLAYITAVFKAEYRPFSMQICGKILFSWHRFPKRVFSEARGVLWRGWKCNPKNDLLIKSSPLRKMSCEYRDMHKETVLRR